MGISDGAESDGGPSPRLLLRPLRFTLCGLLFGVLLCHVVSHNAAADCSDNCVVSGVVAGYAADRRALNRLIVFA